MKKKIITAAITLCLGFGAMAQGSDGFFNDWNDGDGNRATTGDNTFALPASGEGGNMGDEPTNLPLGSGLLILTALGAGYAVAKRKE